MSFEVVTVQNSTKGMWVEISIRHWCDNFAEAEKLIEKHRRVDDE